MDEETSNNICDICKESIKSSEKKRKIIGTWGAKPFEDMTDYDLDHLDELEKDFIVVYEGEDLYEKGSVEKTPALICQKNKL
tara:strand:- start:2365 stop:2610 length:246 start_codon:yes stop_codon:yes gene_type:complete